MRLLWIEGAGDPSIDEDVPLDGDAQAKKSATQKALGPSLDRLAPPSASESAKDSGEDKGKDKDKDESGEPKEADQSGSEEPSKAAPAGGEREKNQVSTSLFVVGLAVEFSGRTFGYNQLLTPNGRNYKLFGTPIPALSAELYPLAGSSIPVVRDLGITASYARALASSPRRRTA